MSIPYMERGSTTMTSDVSVQDSGSADLLVNNLSFQSPKALSLAVNRSYHKSFFQRSAYTGDRSTTMICDINSGTSFINCANSYLAISVQLEGGAFTAASFGSGSAMNVINEVRIRSRSGVELDRVQNANIWSMFDSVYNRSEQNLDTIGALEGFSVGRLPANSVLDIDAGGTASIVKFLIPLGCISPYFRPMQGQLLPPQLASGLRIELSLEDFRTALFQISGSVTGYKITDCYLQLDSVELTDETQRTLNMDSAKDGLEWSYERVYTTITQQPSAQTSISAQVRKAVSQACLVYSMAISAADRVDITKDSLVAVPFNTSSFQYRLGSLYFPNQRIENGTDGIESTLIAYETFDKLRHPFRETSVTPSTFKAKFGVLAASLERDQSLQFSGLAVNNSRTLELDATFASVAENLEVYTFLTYCSVARAFIDNCSVAL
jgi:hypothetical protein